MNNKILFIGDIAGRLLELKELCSLFPNHRKIAVGDLQDRGLYSKQVLDYLIENNIEAIFGNHEEMFLDFMLKNFCDDWIKFLYHGGWKTLASYLPDLEKQSFLNKEFQLEELTNFYKTDEWKNNSVYIQDSNYYSNNSSGKTLVKELERVKELIPKKYVEYIKSLPLYIKEDDWVVTHAPISQDSLKEALADEMFVWKKWRASDKNYHQIYGHCNNYNLRKSNDYYIVCVDDENNNRLGGFDWESKSFTFIDNKA